MHGGLHELGPRLVDELCGLVDVSGDIAGHVTFWRIATVGGDEGLKKLILDDLVTRLVEKRPRSNAMLSGAKRETFEQDQALSAVLHERTDVKTSSLAG